MSNVSWSNTTVSFLRQCSRKYFFAQELAYHGRKGKDRLKCKATELKQMQNILMWTGSVVDKIIETKIIPAIIGKQDLDFNHYADMAVELALRRYKFSAEKKYLDPDLTKTEAGDEFCILDIHEVGGNWSEKMYSDALFKIRKAVLNIPKTLMPDGNSLLIDYLFSENKLLPNINNWSVTIEEALVKPQIDLLLFNIDWKPVIIDWKVSESWVSDYSKQLVIIGLVVFLKRLEKADKQPYKYEEIKLYEVNLLKAQAKEHDFLSETVADMIDYINLTSSDIKLVKDEIKNNNLTIQDSDTTDNQSTCQLCNFKTLCSYLIQNNFQYHENAYLKSLQVKEFAGN